jgi:branched-chain amino acid transport system substrate-binding protein
MVVLGILYLLCAIQLYCFDSIDELVRYTKTVPEYPDSDTDDWSNPDFTSLHRKLKPTWLNRISRFFWEKPLWSVSACKEIVKKVIKQRELLGYTGTFVEKIFPKKGQLVFVWGDLEGSLHSFSRDLEYLRAKRYIDNEFKLAESIFFIINGNAIDKSPYCLETATIIAQLLYKNPEHVIYVRGDIEDKKGWTGRTLERELFIRSPSGSKDKLTNIFEDFFNSLPIVLFVCSEENEQISAIRFSPNQRSKEVVTQQVTSMFLQPTLPNHAKVRALRELNIKNPIPTKLIAIVTNEDRSKTFRYSTGLIRLEEQSENVTTWAVFSGPNPSNRRLYDFFYDAFVKIDTAGPIDSWHVVPIYQDIREGEQFQIGESFFVISGKSTTRAAHESEVKPQKTMEDRKSEPKVEEKAVQKEKPEEEQLPSEQKGKEQFVLEEQQKKEETSGMLIESMQFLDSMQFGCTLDLQRGTVEAAKQKYGMLAYLKQSEQLWGHAPKIFFRDDEYNPKLARENVLKFVSEGIDLILAPSGGPTVESFIDLAAEKKILILFPTVGSASLREEHLDYVFHFRPTDHFEASTLLHIALEKHKVKTIAVFYQDDGYGKGVLDGFEPIAVKNGIIGENITKVSYSRNDVNYVEQAKTIKTKKPDALFLFSTVSASIELIRQLGIDLLASIKIFAIADMMEDTFRNFMKEKGLSVTITSIVPNPKTNKIPLAAMFRQSAEKEKLTLDATTFEGYIYTGIVIDALQKTHKEKGSISKEALIDVLRSYKEYDFYGITLNFDDKRNELSPFLWIYDGKDEWERVSIVEHYS